jgi:hypothetical protein
MIAPQRVLVRWVRVSEKCGVKAVRQCSNRNSLRRLPPPQTPHTTCALHNLRLSRDRIVPEKGFNNLRRSWAATRIAATL